VARQAILDLHGKVAGYELLYRGSVRDTTCTADGDFAGARVLTGAVLDLRFDTLTDGRTAFINLTRSMLLNGAATLVRPQAAAFEVREDVGVDSDVIEACASLHAAGYRLALDDFVPGSRAEQLLPFASFVKVDVLALPRQDVVALVPRLVARGLRVVAEKVESHETFEWTRDAGCGLFQGHYFCRPELRSGRGLPAHTSHLRLLAALNEPTLTMDGLEALVKEDAVLSLRVLQCINSAAFALRREVRSIREALVLLGLGPIRKWASVWCLARLNHGRTTELATLALLRARSCEMLAEGLPEVDSHEMFLVGLCSLLDTMLGRPMTEAIAELPLSEEASAALLGEAGPMRSVLDAVTAYDRGEWELSLDAVESAGAVEADLPRAYTGALAWARGLSQSSLGA
jgi:EAL and modified HD-GYP domain-containing signal transduction protein